MQGKFTSTGLSTKIPLPIDIDQFETYNFTKAVSGTPTGSVHNYWQRGMELLASPNGQSGICEFKSGSNVVNMKTNTTAEPGFQLYDDSVVDLSASINVVSITNATTFTVTATAGLGGLQTGDVVILQSLTSAGNENNIQGFPFQVIKTGNTTFTNTYALASAPGQTATGGKYRIIYSSPQPWYPTQRYIVNIDVTTNTVTTSVNHGYKVGQTVKFSIPQGLSTGTIPGWGTVELDGLSATIIAVTAGTFTVDLNMSSFTAFTWPSSVVGAYNYATVAPAYMNTAIANQYGVDPYSDARKNLGYKGMILYGGTYGPAGDANDVIYWSATAASSVNNQ